MESLKQPLKVMEIKHPFSQVLKEIVIEKKALMNAMET